MINSKHHIPRLPARERPRRRAQPRHHPAGRRSVERGLRSRRAQHQGHDGDSASLRAAAVRRRPRSSLPHADRRGLEPQRRRGRRDRHRGRLDEAASSTASRRPASRSPASASSCTAITTRSCAPPKSRRNTCSGPPSCSTEDCPISDLWVSTKCGESDTTSGCGSNPTVGSAFDKLEPLGVTMCFGETTEITGGENIVADRCATPRSARAAS